MTNRREETAQFSLGPWMKMHLRLLEQKGLKSAG
jgi:hypothetical protein